MYVKDNMYVASKLKLMNDGFTTTLNSGNGLFVNAIQDNQDYGGVFKNFGNGDVRFAHSSGMMIDSFTKARKGYNARFRNQKSSEVLIASQTGNGVVSKTLSGLGWAGSFNYVGKAQVKLAGPDGVGIHSVSQGGLYAAKFEGTKSSGGGKATVTLANNDGSAVEASTAGDHKTPAWAGRFSANKAAVVSLAHTTGEGLRSMSTGKKLWNSVFKHDGISVKIGNHDGAGIKSYTKSTRHKVWNAYFGNAGRSVVRLAHSSGTGIASWTIEGQKWNAVFGNGKPAKSMVKIGHKSGLAIASVTNSGTNYNAVFSNQRSNTVQLSGPKGQGITSTTTSGVKFNAQFINKAGVAHVNVKLAGPTGEGIVAKVIKGLAPAGRFDNNKDSFVELGRTGGQGIYSVTGNDYKAPWNTVIQHGVGTKRGTQVMIGGENGFAIHARTRCVLGPKFNTWTGVFDNAAPGNPKVNLAHSGGQAMHSVIGERSKVYNALFSASDKSSVEMAHNNGRAINSHTTVVKAWNARFSNRNATEVLLGHGEGMAIRSITSEQGSWNAHFSNRKKSNVKLAHWDGVAVYANNNHRSGSYAGHFESINAQKKVESFLKMSHPKGYGMWAHSASTKSKTYAAKFTHAKSKLQVLLSTAEGRAMEVTGGKGTGFGPSLIKLNAGPIAKADQEYKTELKLGSPSGAAIVSETQNAADTVWNTQISYKNMAMVKIGHKSGQGINSATFAGETPNAKFAYKGHSFVTLGGKDGRAIESKSSTGSKFNAKFSHGSSSRLEVAGYDGVVIKAATVGGTAWNSVFVDETLKGQKSSVKLVHTDGTAFKSETKGGTSFNAQFDHVGVSYVKLAHGSGLAIDSVTHGKPIIKPPSQPARRFSKKFRAKKEKKGNNSKKKKSGKELDEESLMEVAEGDMSPSSPSGRFNARFATLHRSSVHLAKASGTALEARSIAGGGDLALFEKGDATNFQRVVLGRNDGTPIHASTRSRTRNVAKFVGGRTTVAIGGPMLLHGVSRVLSTGPAKKKMMVTFKNANMNTFRIRNDGRVIIGEKRKGYLHVSGNAYIEGSLRTIRKGKQVDVTGEMEKIREENAEMKETVQAVQRQNEARMARLEAMEAQNSIRAYT